jgi:hypothetical protein
MNISTKSASILSTVLSLVGGVFAFAAERRAARPDFLLISKFSDSDRSQDSLSVKDISMGPVDAFALTDNGLFWGLFITAAVFAISAILFGLHAYRKQAANHFAAGGVVFGIIVLFWEIKVLAYGV